MVGPLLEPDPEPSGPGMANSKAMPVLGEKADGGPPVLCHTANRRYTLCSVETVPQG